MDSQLPIPSHCDYKALEDDEEIEEDVLEAGDKEAGS
jgi:hypothetical protein